MRLISKGEERRERVRRKEREGEGREGVPPF